MDHGWPYLLRMRCVHIGGSFSTAIRTPILESLLAEDRFSSCHSHLFDMSLVYLTQPEAPFPEALASGTGNRRPEQRTAAVGEPREKIPVCFFPRKDGESNGCEVGQNFWDRFYFPLQHWVERLLLNSQPDPSIPYVPKRESNLSRSEK